MESPVEPGWFTLLAAPDRDTWTGRRDQALLDVAVQTGLRVSELTSLHIDDVELGTGAHVRCHGKGRKQRCTPLSKPTVATLRAWMKERQGAPGDPLFPTRRGTPLTSRAVELLVDKHAATAARTCPSLLVKHPTPHALRHTCAMSLKVRGIASDASFGRVGDWDLVRDLGFGAGCLVLRRRGRHAC